MEPLRVTFRFAHLVSVSDYPLHLDGLLAYASVEKARRDGKEDLDAAAESLPLAREGRPWVWCASALEFAYRSPPSFHTLVRKTDVDDYVAAIGNGTITLGKPRNQLPVDSGPLRNHLVSFTVRQADTATAWCVGDAAAVRALLKDIRQVGKLGRMGYGLVVGCDVVPDLEASEKWKLRQLPWQEEGYVPSFGNFRAPYWDKTAMTEVFSPPPKPIVVGARPGVAAMAGV